MTNVKGTMKVVVSIDKNEAYDALVEELGLTRQIVNNERDAYWKLETAKDGSKWLAYYEDNSYYGNGKYERSQVVAITDPTKVRMYELLTELKELMNKETTKNGQK